MDRLGHEALVRERNRGSQIIGYVMQTNLDNVKLILQTGQTCEVKPRHWQAFVEQRGQHVVAELSVKVDIDNLDEVKAMAQGLKKLQALPWHKRVWRVLRAASLRDLLAV
jgi:hypothetical protein